MTTTVISVIQRLDPTRNGRTIAMASSDASRMRCDLVVPSPVRAAAMGLSFAR